MISMVNQNRTSSPHSSCGSCDIPEDNRRDIGSRLVNAPVFMRTSRRKGSSADDPTRTYLNLRRTVGWIGILLPPILVLGNALLYDGAPLLHSLSRYYYTGMRDVFVGGLCAMALFLFFYSGYDHWDDRVGNMAGVFAVLVAFFPVVGNGEAPGVASVIHYTGALCLFLTLAVYSLVLFGRIPGAAGRKERRRAWIHRASGIIVLGSVIAILLHSFLADCDESACVFVLIAETIAMESFGVSWLVENRGLEADFIAQEHKAA